MTKPTLRDHTHCQVAQIADTQTKTCQRGWLPRHTYRLQRLKHENTTMYIKYLTESVNFKVVTFSEICSGSKGKCFEMPKDFKHELLSEKQGVVSMSVRENIISRNSE